MGVICVCVAIEWSVSVGFYQDRRGFGLSLETRDAHQMSLPERSWTFDGCLGGRISQCPYWRESCFLVLSKIEVSSSQSSNEFSSSIWPAIAITSSNISLTDLGVLVPLGETPLPRPHDDPLWKELPDNREDVPKVAIGEGGVGVWSFMVGRVIGRFEQLKKVFRKIVTACGRGNKKEVFDF